MISRLSTPGGSGYWHSAALAALPALALALAFTASFIHKAYTIDDVTFLFLGQHLLADPLHPGAFEMVFDGHYARVGASAPLMSVLLLPALRAGGAEWIAHVAMAAMLALAALFAAALALRLGMSRRQAMWVSLLTCASPATLAMATTSMPDVPAMTFGLATAERFLANRDDPRIRTAMLCALALATAVLFRARLAPLALCLLPLALERWPTSLRDGWCALTSRRFLLRAAPLALGIVLVALAMIFTRDPLSGHHATLGTVRGLTASNLAMNLANIPTQWVLSFPLGALWTFMHWRRMVASVPCWIAAAAGVGCAMLAQSHYHHEAWLVWHAPVAALGLAVIVDAALDAFVRRDVLEIALVAWLMLAAPAVLYFHLPPKFLVPSAPAMAILLVRHAGHALAPARLNSAFAVATLAGITLGFLIARADAGFAEVGRIAGRDVVRDELARGERVWFDGTWGSQWYASQAGARTLTDVPPLPEAGDVVVTGLNPQHIANLQRKTLVRRIVFDQPGGRVLDAPAGFFSNGWGPLPWIWSSDPLATIEVWRID